MADEGLFPKPVVRAHCHGTPIRSFGYSNILAESPDLLDHTTHQLNAISPPAKITLKSSHTITDNAVGLSIARMPRTAANDELLLEPIHLIDGDPQTCWCSGPYPQPDAEPVWIRLDLPVERTIHKIILRKRVATGVVRAVMGDGRLGSMTLDPGAAEVGMAIPNHLTIKVSRDAWHWDTVFSGPANDAAEFAFPAQPVKQIWIIGRNLPRVENWGYSFSIAGVEALDATGRNVALATFGTGVTTSSTMHGFSSERDAYAGYWAMHYDLGAKWVRLGFHDDMINWHWVEREKGKFTIDPVADAAITDLANNGVKIVLCLNFGNRLYTHDTPQRQLPQLWEWYWENPLPPTTPDALAAWGRYVRFMADHFKDRVHVFEIWNEWNVHVYWGAEPRVDHYLAVAETAIPILRDAAPHHKIMLGSFAGFCYKMASWSPDEARQRGRDDLLLNAVKALAKKVDIIGWHPIYQTPPESDEVLHYTDDIAAFQRYCRDHGFRGQYMITEWAYGASYPTPAEPNWWGTFTCSEMEKAKYIARFTVIHAALNIPSFFTGCADPFYPLDLSLARRAFLSEPWTRMQPQAAYYVMRNLATMLEGVAPTCLDVDIHTDATLPHPLTVLAMTQNRDTLLAIWVPGPATDSSPLYRSTINLPEHFSAATALDPINGHAQSLTLSTDADHTRIADVFITDAPLLIRLST